MNNFAEPTEPIDEFDTFLVDVNKDPVIDIDAKAYRKGLEKRLVTACAEAGYTPLFQDSERTNELYEHLLQGFAELSQENGEPSTDHLEQLAQSSLELLHEREVVALEMIRITTVRLDGAALEGNYSSDNEFKTKAQLLADLVVIDQIDARSPILTVLNKLVPGPEVDLDDPEISPFIIAATESLANTTKQEDWAVVNELFDVLNIDSKDPSETNETLIDAVVTVFYLGRVSLGGTRAAANRLEQIQLLATQNNLNPEMATKMAHFIEKRFPII